MISPANKRISGGTIAGATAPVSVANMRGFIPFSFSLNIEQISRRTSSPSTSVVTIRDYQVDRSTSDSFVSDFKVTVAKSKENSESLAVELYPSNNLLGPIDSNDVMAWQNDGTTIIVGASSLLSRKSVVHPNTKSIQLDTFKNYVLNTLTDVIRKEVDQFITSTRSKTQYTVRDDGLRVYERNSGCLGDIADSLSCVSVWNSTGGSTMAGTLISPRHILFAGHFQINVGSTIRFVSSDNTLVSRTMVGKYLAPNYSLVSSDWCIGVLDSDVPSNIKFARVLPSNYASKIFSVRGTPVVSTNQFKEVSIREVSGIFGNEFTFNPPIPSSPRYPYFQSAIVGDSGNPCFWVIQQTPVLLTVFTFGAAGSGTNLFNYYSQINAGMTALGGGYQLTPIDLSSFPTV